MNKKPTLHTTKDGSHTLYSPTFQQYYHNPNGAVSESKHVFFEQSGLAKALKNHQDVSILEIGFGTGLNFILLLYYLKKLKSKSRVIYTSIEAFPVDSDTAISFDFGNQLKTELYTNLLPEIFNCLKEGWNNFDKIEDYKVELNLFRGLFKDCDLSRFKADFVFQDAFSPEANPELWTVEVFEALNKASSSTAMMSTYCAASSARAAMAKSGWFVARTLGALGKREMTLASKNETQLLTFKRVKEARLIERLDSGEFNTSG